MEIIREKCARNQSARRHASHQCLKCDFICSIEYLKSNQRSELQSKMRSNGRTFVLHLLNDGAWRNMVIKQRLIELLLPSCNDENHKISSSRAQFVEIRLMSVGRGGESKNILAKSSSNKMHGDSSKRFLNRTEIDVRMTSLPVEQPRPK